MRVLFHNFWGYASLLVRLEFHTHSFLDFQKSKNQYKTSISIPFSSLFLSRYIFFIFFVLQGYDTKYWILSVKKFDF